MQKCNVDTDPLKYSLYFIAYKRERGHDFIIKWYLTSDQPALLCLNRCQADEKCSQYTRIAVSLCSQLERLQLIVKLNVFCAWMGTWWVTEPPSKCLHILFICHFFSLVWMICMSQIYLQSCINDIVWSIETVFCIQPLLLLGWAPTVWFGFHFISLARVNYC